MVVLLTYGALFIAFIAFARAVSDHLARVRELKKLTVIVDEARKTAAKRGQLASEIAHDIKNPLTAILCSAEALEVMLGDKVDESHRNCLRYIREYGKNLLQLMSDFLDIHRAEAGQFKPKAEKVPVAKLTRSVVGLLETSASQKGLSLLCTVDDQLLAAVDPKHLRQVLFNLIHNAVKFTPEGGTVTVAVEKTPTQRLEFTVRDTGVGIPPERLSTIFDPYSRYEGNSPQYDVGVGLGLSLCKALITANGGDIVARRREQGTEFSFTVHEYDSSVDLIECPLPEELMIEPVTSKPLTGQTFLIVDGDNGTRESISRLIAAWGGMVDQVAEAADAVEAVARKSYDAVMIDKSGNDLSVHELARIIKDDLKEDTTVIVALREGSEHPGETPIIDKVLQKPFNGEALLKSLLTTGKYEVTH